MDNSTLAEIFNEQAEWREQKAAEHPDDTRNAESAVLLRRLAESAAYVPADLLNAAEELYEDVNDQAAWNEMLRQVGFVSATTDATKFVQEFVSGRTS